MQYDSTKMENDDINLQKKNHHHHTNNSIEMKTYNKSHPWKVSRTSVMMSRVNVYKERARGNHIRCDDDTEKMWWES